MICLEPATRLPCSARQLFPKGLGQEILKGTKNPLPAFKEEPSDAIAGPRPVPPFCIEALTSPTETWDFRSKGNPDTSASACFSPKELEQSPFRNFPQNDN